MPKGERKPRTITVIHFRKDGVAVLKRGWRGGGQRYKEEDGNYYAGKRDPNYPVPMTLRK